MTIAEAIAKRTRDLLIKYNKTQYAIEKEMGIPHRTMLNITGAKHNSTNVKTVMQICKGIGISVGAFFTDPLFENAELEID